MAKFTAIASQGKWFIRRTSRKGLRQVEEYFTGYSYMGNACWTESVFHSSIVKMEKDEAEQIVKDLEAADDPEEPSALEIVLQAAQEHLDYLNYHGCVDPVLEESIKSLSFELEMFG